VGSYLAGLLWVAGVALGAALVAYLVRRIGATEGTVANNEAAGQVFTLVGGLQAVLLAFVLISLFDGVSAAEDGSYAEADGVVAAVWAADSRELSDLRRLLADAPARDQWTVDQKGERVRSG
jgi:hypothetical protein